MTLQELINVCSPTMTIELFVNNESTLFMASDIESWMDHKDKKVTLISQNLRPLGIKVVVG